MASLQEYHRQLLVIPDFVITCDEVLRDLQVHCTEIYHLKKITFGKWFV